MRLFTVSAFHPSQSFGTPKIDAIHLSELKSRIERKEDEEKEEIRNRLGEVKINPAAERVRRGKYP